MSSSTRARRILGTAAAGALIGSTFMALPSGAAPSQNGCDNRTNNTYDKLLECVRLDGVMEHLEEFQAIAEANGGNRADQTPGYQASVDYVVEVLEGAGWSAEVVPFEYSVRTTRGVQQLTPTQATHSTGSITMSGGGQVTGAVIPVDLWLDDRVNSTSGCEESDFAGLDFSGPADIALIQRGSCTFEIKASNAEAAGAEAVILMNTGTPGNTGVLANVTLNRQFDMPVVGVSFAAGQALSAPGSTATMFVEHEYATSHNVIGELAGKTGGNVVMAGAHLDSVRAGSGINDNGTGSAALLEIAQQMTKSRPHNTVRFAWWGAEELGLLGSTQWVAQRTQAELDEIALYLNFDMIGSPNYFFGVYDANESSYAAPVEVPAGSEHIESTFESFYTLKGEPYDDTEFSGRSDYQAFINNGIPSGGLFTGAEVRKNAAQQEIWGGTAGASFDPCYHRACDDLANLDLHALDVNSDAVAFAVFTYAASTEGVNGVRGAKIPGNFTIPAPAGPEHTFAGPLGGGEHDHDHGDEATE